MPEGIRLERAGDIATLILDRPEKLNALTRPMWRGLGETVTEVGRDPAVRCLVLTGAGDGSFSPGNDIAEFERERSDVERARAYGADIARTLEVLRACPTPLVALIRGICVGGGLEIAAMCDIRICGASSRFGVPISRLGLVLAPPEFKGLIDLVGRATALEILLEGRVFGAEEAFQKRLVTRVVPDDQVEAEAYVAARRIADGAPLVARWHKKLARRLEDPTSLSSEELDEGYACYDTEDFRTGYRSFLAKRKPKFEGR
jgi:enoyl-CoA hydratase/carnithine racemase